MLPQPRGPLSALVLEALNHPPHGDDVPRSWRPPVGDEVAGEDPQLALWLLTEVALGGLPGVDPDWEWQPQLIAMRNSLTAPFEQWVRENVAAEIAELATHFLVDPAEAMASVIAGDQAPDLSRWAQRWMSLEQFREYLVLRSIYQLREGDQHSMVIPRLPGPAKVALMEIQYDEYGSGRPERQHSHLFAVAMAQAGLSTRLLDHLDQVPASALVANNFLSLCGLLRRLRGAVAGHLALYEATSCLPSKRWAATARRLNLPAAQEYFDEHVEADAVHEQLALTGMVGELLRTEPKQADAVAFGVAGVLFVEGRAAAERNTAWRAGATNLRPALVERVA